MSDSLRKLIASPAVQRTLQAFQPTPLELFLFTYLAYKLTDPMPPFHRTLLRVVEASAEIAILAPRKFGKSVLLTLGYVAYAICTGQSSCVLIASANAKEAQRRIKDLRFLFETNDLLRRTFHVKLGREFGGAWSSSDLDFMINGQLVQVHGRGMTSQIRGIHPDLVIIDDPEETKGAASPDVRNMVMEVYTRSILPTRNPKDNLGRKAKIFLIGTPINPEVLVQRAFVNWDGRFEGFARLRFKAIEDGETVLQTGVPVGESIFPARFPLEYLMEERARLGHSAFAAEYLCSPMAAGSQIFYEEYFTTRYSELPPNHRLFTIVSVDPARTTQDARYGSDTAILCGSVERSVAYDPLAYIRAARIGHMAPKERARETVRMALDHGGEYIWVEDTTRVRGSLNAPSDVVELIRLTADEMGAGHRFMTSAHRPDVDKHVRAQRAAVACEQGRVLFPTHLAGDMYTLYNQMVLYPNVEKNDGVDAFSMLMEKLALRHGGGRPVRAGGDAPATPAFISKFTKRRPLTRAVGWN